MVFLVGDVVDLHVVTEQDFAQLETGFYVALGSDDFVDQSFVTLSLLFINLPIGSNPSAFVKPVLAP